MSAGCGCASSNNRSSLSTNPGPGDRPLCALGLARAIRDGHPLRCRFCQHRGAKHSVSSGPMIGVAIISTMTMLSIESSRRRCPRDHGCHTSVIRDQGCSQRRCNLRQVSAHIVRRACFRSFGQFIRRIGHSRRTPALYLTSTAKYRVCGGAVVIGDQRTAVDLGPAARLQFEPLTRNRHGHLPVLLLFRETDPQLGKC